MKEHYKFDDFGKIPFSLETRKSEGRPTVKNTKVKVAGSNEREDVSESVGEGSLNGWVKKNIKSFEVTEGRL